MGKGLKEPEGEGVGHKVLQLIRVEVIQAQPGVKVLQGQINQETGGLRENHRVIMSQATKHQCHTLEEDLQAQNEAQGSVNAQVPAAEESFTPFTFSFHSSFSSSFSSSSPSALEAFVPSSPCSSSSSFHFSYPSTSPSSSPLNLSIQDKEESLGDMILSTPQSPQRSTSLSTSASTKSSLRDPLEKKVTDLVHLLLVKYQMRQPITKAEMLDVIITRSKKQFTVIFNKAYEFLEMVFGINMKEVDPTIHSYVLVSSLDLTYDKVVNSGQSIPKNGLLIIILGVIFLEGNSIPEEDIWEMLNIMGVYAGREHVIYGEPRQVITKDWVQEKYLEYRQVPNSDPTHYEFLWGPRSHVEISKIKVLEFLAKLNGVNPSSFSPRYEEALRDKEERAHASIDLTGSSTDMLIAQCWPTATLAPKED
ncbi:PREDICTED: melanoma-associated antigen 10-like [Chrysochloris asiatica]|uniref:Melanoma-associated antigen 10-like n=1 Tax=Chrysochloris asiatica TaxID=185453 RepID=A0A9B0TTH3_CHRAS|nr:PREDICTED: melanoma-associated antigen 10-like [Chrysochloris asiatica]